ncbi:MAG: DUF1634 domain-containing protein [Bacillota bacterium]
MDGKRHHASSKRQLVDIELLIGNFLRTGVTVCGIVIIAGLIWHLLRHHDEAKVFPSTLPAIWQGLLAGRGYAVIDAGLVLLILTPVLRVAVSVVWFMQERDLMYVLITVFVLGMLMLSFFLGKAG